MSTINVFRPRDPVCPRWLIRAFDNPLRRLVQNPERILQEFVEPGDRCLDVGCGYGYFTIPLARLVGPSGSITAVDIQSEMLKGARRRAEKAHLLSRIHFHQSDSTGLHIPGAFDFALAFWVLHEVADQESILAEICGALKVGGHFLLSEPRIHVAAQYFHRIIAQAEERGFERVSDLRIFFSRSLIMEKAGQSAA
jgi:ubiquinone/menaquinone biosynthesis C-methylase UbiE